MFQITDVSQAASASDKAAVTKNTGLAMAAAAIGIALGPLLGGYLSKHGIRCVRSLFPFYLRVVVA